MPPILSRAGESPYARRIERIKENPVTIDDASLADDVTPSKGAPTLDDDISLTEAPRVVSDDADATDHDSAWWQNPANFLSGARPISRAVVIYGRGDLYARIDELAELEVRSTGAEAAAYKAEATALTSELLASAMTVVIEARSSEWIERFRSRMDKLKIEDPVERTLRQIAGQISEPDFGGESEAYEFLRAFSKVSDVQVAIIAERLMDVNSRIPVVNPRFLAASSVAARGQGFVTR